MTGPEKRPMRPARQVATLLLASVLTATAAAPAVAQYRYGGGGGYGGSGENRWSLLLEAQFANVRNADVVLATAQGPTQTGTLTHNWDDDTAGRLGVGYRFANGGKLVVIGWGFETEAKSAGAGPDGGSLFFGIGPAIPFRGGFVGDTGSPGSYNLTTEIQAGTGDLAWISSSNLSERMRLDWSAGVRFARYEETTRGFYDGVDGFQPGSGPVLVSKSIKSDMVGVRLGLRGEYRFTRALALAGGFGLSWLDGEIEATSTLEPRGLLLGGGPLAANTASVKDDGRSGTIRDVELALVWNATGDALRITFGWEQSVWDGVVTDLVRNWPGTFVPLAERDSLSFSGYKLGLHVAF